MNPLKNKQPKKIYGADRIAITGFGNKGFVIAKPAEAYSPWLQERIQQLHTKVSGSTNMADGLEKAVEVSSKTPRGILRRIWLLSDGYPTVSKSSVMLAVAKAKSERININTIGFGDVFDEALLREISSSTHNGQFFRVASLRELTNALVLGGSPNNTRNKRHFQAETTVFCIDLSGSMFEAMEGKLKIQVVQEALLHLLHYKQKCFS